MRRTNSQLLTLPSGSGIKGAVSSWRHLPSTINLYWWYLHHTRPQASEDGRHWSTCPGCLPLLLRLSCGARLLCCAACSVARWLAVRAAAAAAHPGGRWTTTAKTPGEPSTGAIGTVSTHRVNEPQRCTCGAAKSVASLCRDRVPYHGPARPPRAASIGRRRPKPLRQQNEMRPPARRVMCWRQAAPGARRTSRRSEWARRSSFWSATLVVSARCC
jgi:hypothetical protein